MRKLIAICALIPTMAYAEFWSGNDLYNRITSYDATDRIQALGYVMGAYDMGVHASFCPPTEVGITSGQIRDIARQYLEANPTKRHRSADRLLSEAFRQIWPCRSSGGRGA